jgi:hypothetical protein
MQSRFQLRHAVTGYIVALVFAFNGLLTSVIDASVASGGGSFALITCLGGQVPGQRVPGQQLPGQSDHASKCSCNLSGCCTGGSLSRNGSDIDVHYPTVSTAFLQRSHAPIARDVRPDHPLHLRSPPAMAASA